MAYGPNFVANLGLKGWSLGRDFQPQVRYRSSRRFQPPWLRILDSFRMSVKEY